MDARGKCSEQSALGSWVKETVQIISSKPTLFPGTLEETERPSGFPKNRQQVRGRAGTEPRPHDSLDGDVFTPPHRLRDEREATERCRDLLTYLFTRGTHLAGPSFTQQTFALCQVHSRSRHGPGHHAGTGVEGTQTDEAFLDRLVGVGDQDRGPWGQRVRPGG